MNIISKRLFRLRQWQQDSSLHIAKPSSEQHRCHCCNSDYVGNFCPQCGQKAGVGRISWETVRRGLSMLWGMDSRSLPYTLWQLILRPGYLIGDYIGGKRQVSFPPIKMLALVAVFVYLCLESMSSIEQVDDTLEDYTMLNHAAIYFTNHLDLGVLFLFSTLIIPTYFIFRFSPRCPHHNLPEGIFIQVFDSTKALLWLLLIAVVSLLIDDEEMNDDMLIMCLMAFVVTYRSYHQLFGYGIWGTLWRTICVLFAAWLVMLVLACADYAITQLLRGDFALALNKLHAFILCFLGLVFSLAVPYFISRRMALRKRNHWTSL